MTNNQFSNLISNKYHERGNVSNMRILFIEKKSLSLGESDLIALLHHEINSDSSG